MRTAFAELAARWRRGPKGPGPACPRKRARLDLEGLEERQVLSNWSAYQLFDPVYTNTQWTDFAAGVVPGGTAVELYGVGEPLADGSRQIYEVRYGNPYIPLAALPADAPHGFKRVSAYQQPLDLGGGRLGAIVLGLTVDTAHLYATFHAFGRTAPPAGRNAPAPASSTIGPVRIEGPVSVTPAVSSHPGALADSAQAVPLADSAHLVVTALTDGLATPLGFDPLAREALLAGRPSDRPALDAAFASGDWFSAF